jgi:hypothetical protein
MMPSSGPALSRLWISRNGGDIATWLLSRERRNASMFIGWRVMSSPRRASLPSRGAYILVM